MSIARLETFVASPHNGTMGARELIGLEAALAELGGLYVAAKRFAPLRPLADQQLRRRSEELAAELRAKRRHGALDDAAVDAAAREIAGLRAVWQKALAEVRTQPVYREALEAWRSGNAGALRERLPELIAGLRAVAPPPRLHWPVPVAAPRGTPRAQPFQTPEQCREAVLRYRRDGISTSGRGQRPDDDFGYVELVDDPRLLDGAVALRFDAARLELPVFAAHGEHAFRIYAPRLRAPFSVLVADRVDDEWWEVSEEPYAHFRDCLIRRLTEAGLTAERFETASR